MNIEGPVRQAPKLPALESLPAARLASMHAAGQEVLECYRVLRKGGCNLVGEILRGAGTFYEHEHYPKDDVHDPDSGAQYYYHAHRGAQGEHGHFHCFLRAPGMPPGVEPIPYDGTEPWPRGEEAIAHLVAIAMEPYGWPIALFTTNRWVTAETWYGAAQVTAMLDRFVIDHAFPSWPVNRWLSAMFRLYQPYMAALLEQRDAVIDGWRRTHPDVDVFEDRALEITGCLPISVEEHIAAVAAAACR